MRQIFSVSHNKVLRVAQVAVGSSTAAVLLLRWRFSHKIMEVKSNRIWQRKSLISLHLDGSILSFPPVTHPTCLNRGFLRGRLLPQTIERIPLVSYSPPLTTSLNKTISSSLNGCVLSKNTTIFASIQAPSQVLFKV